MISRKHGEGMYTLGIATEPSTPRHAKAAWSVCMSFGPQLNEERRRNAHEEENRNVIVEHAPVP
jgi:hypothetical protein